MKKLTYNYVEEYFKNYEITLLSKEYINNRTPLMIQCKYGHITPIRFDNFKRTHNCPQCSRHYGAYTEEEVITYLESFEYTLLSKYVGIHDPIIIKCPQNHIYETSFNIFKSNGCRCSHCKASKGEVQISNILERYNINNIKQFTFDDCKYITYLPFDFYLPKYNILIEYDGIQHFEPTDFAGKGEKWAREQFEKNKIKDTIKTKYCQDNNIKLIRIPYWDFNNIEEILIKELKL